MEARADLLWSPETYEHYEWLHDLLEVPEDASAPLAMTPPPADAVGSYGQVAIEWIEESQNITLRWWQRLAITRQLEHREDGTLCHRQVIESCPRRAGKSVRMRGLALWRMAHPTLFGEVQTIVHTGSDIPICREIQRGAWRWAEDAKWTVTRANGKEAIETPIGDRWLVRSQDAVYGYDVGLALVDEAWNVKPDTVSEGLEPATLERHSPQVHLTSTAHRRATSLMRQKLMTALTIEDPETLLLLWAAPQGSDPSDPEVWRAASPHWSDDRRRLISAKYDAALSGQVDPQADDPDPMAGFIAQYLNVWPLRAPRLQRGDAVLPQEAWEALGQDPPFALPDSAAIESWFADGVSLALAWKVGSRAVVSVTDHPDMAAAVAALKESGYRGVTTVGSSLMKDPELGVVRKRPGEGRTVAAVQDLQRLVNEDVFRHDGTEHLTDQVLAVRTLPGADGPRMASTGRADALKAAVWATQRVRAGGSRQRILLPSA